MNTTTPGIRFSRVGTASAPQHLVDVWLMAEATRTEDYVKHPEQYRAFQREVDRAFGQRARFVFVGELDHREDLDTKGLLQELLNDLLGLDLLCPVAACTPLAVSVHRVPRWGDYCLLLSGWAAKGTDWTSVKAYVVRWALSH